MKIIEFFGTVIKPKIVKGKKMLCPIENSEISEDLYCIRDKDVNVFLIKNHDEWIAIDCGYKNSSWMERGLNELNIDGSKVTDVFLTHVDLDHAGGVDKYSKKIFPNANIYVGQEEAKYLKNKYYRKKVLFIGLRTPISIDKYQTLKDSDIIKIGENKIEAIFTPGHTMGHVSFLVNDKYLFVGDSLIMNHEGGYCFYDLWNIDSNLNKESLIKLKRISEDRRPELIITAHSGLTDDRDLAFANIGKSIDWKVEGFEFIKDAPYDPYN